MTTLTTNESKAKAFDWLCRNAMYLEHGRSFRGGGVNFCGYWPTDEEVSVDFNDYIAEELRIEAANTPTVPRPSPLTAEPTSLPASVDETLGVLVALRELYDVCTKLPFSAQDFVQGEQTALTILRRYYGDLK